MTLVSAWLLVVMTGLGQEMQTVERIQPDPQLGNTPPQAPAGKSVLGGRVVNARTKEPIKKAHVMLNGPTNLSAVTDGNGLFTFRALPAGEYMIAASRDEFYADAASRSVAQRTLSGNDDIENLEIGLLPGSVITGRVLDEDEVPVPQCAVTAIRPDRSQNSLHMVTVNSTTTDDEGKFRIHQLQGGRYILKAKCPTVFQAPHGFMRRNDPLVPHEGYGVVFIGAGNSASPSSGVPVPAGGELTGLDFHVKRVPVYSVSGTLSGVDEDVLPGAQLVLVPVGSDMPEATEITAGMDRSRERHLFRDVPAGSYEVIATVFNAEHAYEGRQTLEVGKMQLTEFNVKLTAGAAIAGTLEVDDPAAKRFDNMQISLQPLTSNYRGPVPVATLGGDGTFEFKSVLPGHFRLNQLPMGYIKSVSIAGRDVTPQDFEVTGGSVGPMHISVGSKWGRVDVEASAALPQDKQIWGLLLPEAVAGAPAFSMAALPAALSFPNVAPGKYRILVTSAANPMLVANQPGVLSALESHTVEVEVAEGDSKKMSAPVISAEDLQKAVDAAE